MEGNLTIVKTKQNKNFTIMSLITINDNRLSWKAKGLHTYLISRPPDWTVYLESLKGFSSDGTTSLKSALKELIMFGYLFIKKERDKTGKFVCEYTVYETPKI